MKYKYGILLGIVALASFQAQAKAASMFLETANDFAVLGGSTVTNTGPSVITGNLGVSPGSAITGFPPGIVTPPGTINTNDAVASQAQTDNQNAFNTLAGLTPPQDLTGQDLGGLTLLPGIYSFDSSAQLTGILTLNNLADPNGLFVFQIGSTLTTASNSSVLTSGFDDPNVFFQVGSSATLGTGTQFTGNILANQSITLNTGANIGCGRALAQVGAVTLDTNNVSNACQVVPEPDSSLGILGFGVMGMLFAFRKRLPFINTPAGRIQ